MAYFIATKEETLAEELVRLFRNNMQKLYRLLESVILNQGPQFTAELTKELNRMLEIKTRLLAMFYLQVNKQTEYMNHELE